MNEIPRMCALLALAGLSLALGVCPRSRHIDLRLIADPASRASVRATSSAHDASTTQRPDAPTRVDMEMAGKLYARLPLYSAQGLRMRPYAITVSGPSLQSSGVGLVGDF